MVKTCKFVSSLVLNLILKVSCAIYKGTLAGLQPAQFTTVPLQACNLHNLQRYPCRLATCVRAKLRSSDLQISATWPYTNRILTLFTIVIVSNSVIQIKSLCNKDMFTLYFCRKMKSWSLSINRFKV